MSSRESHTKTRNGCIQCKRRHVKCDLRAPVCENCSKREQWCDYQLLGTDDYAPHHYTQSSLASSLSLVPTMRNSLRLSAFSDFSPAIFLSLGQHEPRGNWDPVIVQEISKRAFLQHAFLALSALLQQYDSPSKANQEYINAYTHHIEASTVFRHAMSTSTDHNWLASLVFAMTVIVFHFRVTATQPSKESVAETILVLRSAAKFARSVALPFLKAQSIVSRHLKDNITSMDPQLLGSITSLKQLIDGLEWKRDGLKSVYEQSVETLRQWIAMTRGHPQIWLDFVWWPVQVNSEYVDLLAQRQPVALIIFLHWCSVMTNAPKRWFLDGWADALARQAFDSLEPQWMSFTSWPSLVFGLDSNQFLLQTFGDASHQAAKTQESVTGDITL